MIKFALEMLSLKFASLLTLRNVAPLAAGQVGSTSTILNQKHESDSISSSINNHQMRSISMENQVLQATAEEVENVAASQVRVPTPPKKPKTPWLLFVSDRRDEYLRRNPSIKPTQLISSLAKDYQTSDKSKYQEMYKRLHDDYLRSKASYENMLTEQQRAQIEHDKDSKRAQKIKRELNKLKPPTLPRNSANLYCSDMCQTDEIKEMLKSRAPASVLKDLFVRYRSLDDSLKKKYLDMQAKDRERFASEFNSWYESIMNNKDIRSSVKEKVEAMHVRYKLLGYI